MGTDKQQENDDSSVATKVERRQAKRMLFEQKRKDKSHARDSVGASAKITRCDREAHESIVKKVQPEAIDFDCWRCSASYNSRNQYEWSISEGVKVICSGCNGFLLAYRNNPKPIVGDVKAEKQSNKRVAIDGDAKQRKSGSRQQRQPLSPTAVPITEDGSEIKKHKKHKKDKGGERDKKPNRDAESAGEYEE